MGMLADRIVKNSRHLRKWGKRQGFSCLRLYDHDIPEIPLSLDDYEGRFLVTLSQGATFEPDWLEGLTFQELVVKERGQPGGELDPARAFLVQEGPMKFEVNLHAHQDTGLFLDHRLTREWVRSLAQGAEVLNLFCYTGSFSVAAALGGARRVTSVDLSHNYLDWAGRNFLHNGLSMHPHLFVQDDILRWLPQALDAEQSYDLIICDPPTFSNSKRMKQTFDLQKLHGSMLRGLQGLLRSGGRLIFSCNDRGFRLDEGLAFEEITGRTRSEDFRRRGGHRCWQWHKADTPARPASPAPARRPSPRPN